MNYSDQVYQNISESLKDFLTGKSTLTDLDIRFLEEYDPSRCQNKPVLLIQFETPIETQMGIDGGFWTEDIDTITKTVLTVHSARITPNFILDLGTNTPKERYTWSVVIKRAFEDAREAGIPVLDFAASATSTVELGRLYFSVEEDFSHNYLPEIPEDRTWRNVMKFTPYYHHKFIKTPNQPQLTGVELNAKEVAI